MREGGRECAVTGILVLKILVPWIYRSLQYVILHHVLLLSYVV